MISGAVANDSYSFLNSVADDAEQNFNNAANVQLFADRFLNKIGSVKGPLAKSVKAKLRNIASNSAVNHAYHVAKVNQNSTNAILSSLAGLNSANAAENLMGVSKNIATNPSFSSVKMLNSIANNASSQADSIRTQPIDRSGNYDHWLNEVTGPLFRISIDQIIASGFNHVRFSNFIGSIKDDLSNDPRLNPDFISDMDTDLEQNGYRGSAAQAVKSVLDNLADDPRLSQAYQAVRANSANTNVILDNLSGMNSANEYDNLSHIAKITQSDYSNPIWFGSLAANASNMAASVSNHAVMRAQKNSAAVNGLIRHYPLSSILSSVINKIADRNSSNGYRYTSLMNVARNDLTDNLTAKAFLKQLGIQVTNIFGGSRGEQYHRGLRQALNNASLSSAIENAYAVAYENSGATEQILSAFGAMDDKNVSSELNNVASVIDESPSLADLNQMSSFADVAHNVADSLSTSVNNLNIVRKSAFANVGFASSEASSAALAAGQLASGAMTSASVANASVNSFSGNPKLLQVYAADASRGADSAQNHAGKALQEAKSTIAARSAIKSVSKIAAIDQNLSNAKKNATQAQTLVSNVSQDSRLTKMASQSASSVIAFIQTEKSNSVKAEGINSLLGHLPFNVGKTLNHTASQVAANAYSENQPLSNLMRDVDTGLKSSSAITFLRHLTDQTTSVPRANSITRVLTGLASNPSCSSAVNDAYDVIRNSSSATHQALSDLSTMNSNNVPVKLSDFASVLNSAFSSYNVINSVANDVWSGATSISSSLSASNARRKASLAKSAAIRQSSVSAKLAYNSSMALRESSLSASISNSASHKNAAMSASASKMETSENRIMTSEDNYVNSLLDNYEWNAQIEAIKSSLQSSMNSVNLVNASLNANVSNAVTSLKNAEVSLAKSTKASTSDSAALMSVFGMLKSSENDYISELYKASHNASVANGRYNSQLDNTITSLSASLSQSASASMSALVTSANSLANFEHSYISRLSRKASESSSTAVWNMNNRYRSQIASLKSGISNSVSTVSLSVESSVRAVSVSTNSEYNYINQLSRSTSVSNERYNSQLNDTIVSLSASLSQSANSSTSALVTSANSSASAEHSYISRLSRSASKSNSIATLTTDKQYQSQIVSLKTSISNSISAVSLSVKSSVRSVSVSAERAKRSYANLMALRRMRANHDLSMTESSFASVNYRNSSMNRTNTNVMPKSQMRPKFRASTQGIIKRSTQLPQDRNNNVDHILAGLYSALGDINAELIRKLNQR